MDDVESRAGATFQIAAIGYLTGLEFVIRENWLMNYLDVPGG